MDFDQVLTDLTPFMHETLGGEQFILRRSNTLQSVKASTTPKALELATPALTGAVAVALRLPGAGAMKGSILEGAVLVIDGEEYSVTAAATAPAPTGTVLAAVPIDPPLPGPLVEGEPVELRAPTYTLENVLLVTSTRREDSGSQAATGVEILMEISVPVLGAPTTPKNGDGVQRVKDGTLGRIAGTPLIIGGSWEVKVGAP